MSSTPRRVVKWAVVVAVCAALLYVVLTIYLAHQALLATAFLVFCSLAVYTYTAPRAYTWRYLFPGLAGMAIFVIFPLLYTVRLGFTNYSTSHLQSFDSSTEYFLEERLILEGQRYNFTLHADGDRFRLRLEPFAEAAPEPPAEGVQAVPPGPAKPVAIYVTPPLSLGKAELVNAVRVRGPSDEPKGPALDLTELIRHREAIARVTIRVPGDAKVAEIGMTGLHEFSPVTRAYAKNANGTLTRLMGGDVVTPSGTLTLETGQIITPNPKTGFYETAAGDALTPGYKVDVGFSNYQRLWDPEVRGPFFRVFAWTVAFAALTVLITMSLGMTLAVLLNWEALRFRAIYRTMIFLPYAVPGFISILVFKGLFNQNFGEINRILFVLFHIKPDWFNSATLARCMILIVNTWLGYPYMMVLCTGLIKAIPVDIYEASALAGAGPLTNFFKITAPLILKPLTPLLVASFAFNFNNYVLIALLTGGRPDFLEAMVPAGETDILVTYLNRIAFEDSGQQFGLASAIATVIFFLVAGLSVLNLKLTKANVQEQRF